MTTDSTRRTPLVRLRSDGTVDEATLTYARTKIDAVLTRDDGRRGEERLIDVRHGNKEL